MDTAGDPQRRVDTPREDALALVVFDRDGTTIKTSEPMADMSVTIPPTA